jgi:probable F420-dependent oxidoreductase
MTGTDRSALIASTKARLGRVGVWLGALNGVGVDEERKAVARIEELGYGSLWTGEIVGGKEAFAHQAVLLSSSERIITGTGIANLWSRHPATAEGGARTLAEAWPGRFIFGLGISHALLIDSIGETWDRPLARMSAYLDAMDAAAVHGPHVDVPRVLAALRPKMMELARDKADGAHPYFVPAAHTPLARAALGPDRLLIPEQAVVLETDPSEARRVARSHMSMYLMLPNYVNNLLHLGYSQDDVGNGGSDRLVDAIVAWGDEAAIAARVAEHHDGGADHVLLQPLGDMAAAVAQLERLAPALLED